MNLFNGCSRLGSRLGSRLLFIAEGVLKEVNKLIDLGVLEKKGKGQSVNYVLS